MNSMTNYSIDDTFRALAKPEYKVMVRLHKEWSREWSRSRVAGGVSVITANYIADREVFLLSHGWTWQELIDSYDGR